MSLVPSLPLSLQELLDYYRIAQKECEFLIDQLQGSLGHLEARMRPSPLVSVRFNSYESYFVDALSHLKWRLASVCVDESYEFNNSQYREAILEQEYQHSGIGHPIGEEEIQPMLSALESVRGNLELLITEIESSMLKSIFLCHASVDKPFVRKIAQDLTRRGSRVWLDEAEINVGDSILAKIEDGIKTSDYLGVVLSENAVKSVWVAKEVEAALTQEIESGRVKVVPFLLSDCDIPLFLRPKKYADFRDAAKYAEGINAVVGRLSSGA